MLQLRRAIGSHNNSSQELILKGEEIQQLRIDTKSKDGYGVAEVVSYSQIPTAEFNAAIEEGRKRASLLNTTRNETFFRSKGH